MTLTYVLNLNSFTISHHGFGVNDFNSSSEVVIFQILETNLDVKFTTSTNYIFSGFVFFYQNERIGFSRF